MITRLGPGLWRIATAKNDRENAFLAESDDGVTLIDVGWKSAARIILDDVRDQGWEPNDIKRVLLTHAHPDHVRGLGELVQRTGASVHVHQLEAHWLRGGRVPREGRSGALARIADTSSLLHWRPITADALLEDGVIVSGLRTIHTPGHSPGHVVFHHLESDTVLVGDAVFNRSRLATGPDSFATDPGQRDETLGLLPTGANAIGFAHGTPLVGSEVDRLTEFLAIKAG